MPFIGPILVVIDPLDESGDTAGEYMLHRFLANSLSSLPQNFRVLITSQPEDGIESAFLAVESVIIKHMNDHELQQRIATFSPFSGRDSLPHDFKQYGEALATRAEGLFQWAVAACEDILEPDP